VSLLREIAAIAAPIAIVMGLATRRRTSTTWPAIVVAIGVAGTALALVYVGSNAWGFYNDSPFDFGDVAAQKLELATQLLGPLILPGLGALAWSGLSALSAGEQPRRFWLALTGGSVAMLSAYVIGLALTWVLSSVGSGYPTDLSINIDQALTWVSVAAIGLFLLAFALGMPGDPFDLGDVTEDPGVPGEATA